MTVHDAATPADVIRTYRNVEQADRIYFCGWRDNTVRGDRVSSANLAKTRRCLGQAAHDLCRRRNLSSRRTDDPHRARDYFAPDAVQA
ncbi:DUF6037 family protein [Lysobacter sp. GX 14042]|uniref:DUF6037 family protein n=1 Tax=Lysobacter sp. GX 14042 TaxID=2907155 RepID=UPI001F23EF6E|nr:DUF6037 family protein [Lysobacter sp. GX 14042]MCE7032883.1 DUF6037 family protein [Lysobacter sp. GX 14042]